MVGASSILNETRLTGTTEKTLTRELKTSLIQMATVHVLAIPEGTGATK